ARFSSPGNRQKESTRSSGTRTAVPLFDLRIFQNRWSLSFRGDPNRPLSRLRKIYEGRNFREPAVKGARRQVLECGRRQPASPHQDACAEDANPSHKTQGIPGENLVTAFSNASG